MTNDELQAPTDEELEAPPALLAVSGKAAARADENGVRGTPRRRRPLGR